MGPFPHNAPRSKITKDNPAGTDGFAFVEFMDPNPDHLRSVFTNMGYEKTAVHKTKAIELWQQGDITYVLNSEPDGLATRFGAVHGPCAPSMGWRVVDAQRAFAHAVAQGAEPYIAADRSFNMPAIKGIGGFYILSRLTEKMIRLQESLIVCALICRRGLGFITSTI